MTAWINRDRSARVVLGTLFVAWTISLVFILVYNAIYGGVLSCQ